MINPIGQSALLTREFGIEKPYIDLYPIFVNESLVMTVSYRCSSNFVLNPRVALLFSIANRIDLSNAST